MVPDDAETSVVANKLCWLADGEAKRSTIVLWLQTETALRCAKLSQCMWRPAVEDWASETQTYVFSYGFLCRDPCKNLVIG